MAQDMIPGRGRETNHGRSQIKTEEYVAQKPPVLLGQCAIQAQFFLVGGDHGLCILAVNGHGVLQLHGGKIRGNRIAGHHAKEQERHGKCTPDAQKEYEQARYNIGQDRLHGEEPVNVGKGKACAGCRVIRNHMGWN